MQLITKLTLACFFLSSQLWAQNTPLHIPLSISDRPEYSDDLPEFVKMTYRPNVNFKAVEEAFEAYEKVEKAKKARTTEGEEVEDKYDVFFHRWKRAYEPFAQSDGTIVLPTQAEYKRQIKEQNFPAQQQLRLRSPNSGNWTNIGPQETHWLKDDNAAQPPCPWQVNIYAFDISKSNTSVLYACPETGGIWKTTDKGLNWTECRPDLKFGGTGSSVEIHPTDPNTVYVGVGSFLWKTTDGGNTWVDLTNCTASNPNDIAISPSDPNIVMVVADNGFFRSTDGGSTWTRIYTSTCYDIEFNPTNASHVFILKTNGTNTEFLKSTDSGASFTVKSTGISTLTSGRLAVTVADGNRIYALCTSSPNPPKLLKSADEGETWTDINATFCTGGVSDATGGQGYYDLSIAASQTNANELIFGLCTTVKAVSTDGGATFSYTLLGGYCGSFALHPDLQEAKSIMNNGVMETWVSTDGGFTFSTDFFTSTSNAAARNNGIYSTNFWGFAQGWNEDILVGGRYHNGNTAISENYPAGKALRMGGGEQGTGYVLHGNSNYVVYSDLGDGWILPNSFYENSQGRFKYVKRPNEDGYGFNSTPLILHPNYLNHHFLGEGNSLWKTTDRGLTFVSLYDFGSRVRRFDVSRSNPSVMYVATDAGFNKSIDGGATWTPVALPSGRNGANLYLAINPTNDQDVWICFSNISGAGKVYQTTNGGGAWTIQDGTTLGSSKIRSIVHTGSGVYIAAADDDGRVFYRSVNAFDWTDFSTNLPISMDILRIIPFYRDGKLRVGGNRGAWETPFAEDVPPLAMPTVDKKTTDCARDTFYFDDYSILKQAGATWTWSFSPTPQYVSDIHARNPKVIFGQTGDFTATLTVTNSAGTSTKTVTNMVSIATNLCDLTTTNTTAGSFSGATTSFAQSFTPAPNLGNSNFSIGLWFKTTSTASDAVMITDKDWDSGKNKGWVLSLSSGRVTFNIGDGTNRIDMTSPSGTTYNDNKWHHAAASVTRGGNAVLYIDGVQKGTVATSALQNIYSGNILSVGAGLENDYPLLGQIEEIKIWNAALTEGEIREKMHLIAEATEPNLISYLQFNNTGTTEYDRKGTNHLVLSATASRVASTAPVGLGTSQRISVTTGGIKDFANADCKMEFPTIGLFPNGEVVVSKITNAPDQNPTGGTPLSNSYWIINNFGSNSVFSPLLNLKFNNLSGLSSPATNYKLYRRNFNADGATWGTTLDGGDNLANNTLTFTPAAPCVGITSFGQFAMTDDASATPPAPTGDDCIVGTVRGKSLSVATNQSLSSAVNLTNITRFTTSAWIKPNGAQAGYAGIVSNGEWCAHCPTNTNGLIFDYYGTKLWYRWAGVDDTWASNSGLTVPLNEWSYVAMVVTPDSVALYLNDQKYVRIFSGADDRPSAASIANLYLGYGHYYAYFKGEIEEVRIWDKALTQNQIREMRHITDDNAFESDANFQAYYQFNEQLSGNVLNNAKNVHGILNNGATLIASTAPIGSGVSQRMAITSGGVKTFATPEVDIEFSASGTYPNGEIVVSKINIAPDQNPTGGTPLSNYWIINNYGTNQTFTPLTNIKFNNLGSFGTGTASNFKLYRRNANGEGATWGINIDGGDVLASNNLTFAPPVACMGITNFGQFTMTNDAATSPPSVSEAECAFSTVIGTAMKNTNNGDYMLTPAINLNKDNGSNNDEITIMAWIRPNVGTQSSYAGILSCVGVNVNLNYRDNNELGIHWNDGQYNWSSGITVPPDEWSHVALVVAGTRFRLYINGKEAPNAAANTADPAVLNLANRQWYIGNDRGTTGRTFKGLIDEVCFYNRALSVTELREKMHIVKSSSEIGLKGYFQFNETNSTVWNKVDGSFSAMTGATRLTATAPVGIGTAATLAVASGGVKDFTGTDCAIEFPTVGTLPNGDIVVTKLNVSPNGNPASGTPLSNQYWIVNNYGTNTTFSTLSRLSFSNLGSFATGNPSSYKLYKRSSNAEGATWGTALDAADEFASTNNNTLTFSTGNSVTSFSQFIMSQEAVLTVELLDFNAQLKDGKVELTWQVVDEKSVNHYQIERSFDGKAFELLKKQEKGKFSSQDETPQYGLNYYRLKIVENDGQTTYSPIRSVNMALGKKIDFAVYPNPAQDILNIKFNSDSPQDIDFELVNAVGQIVHRYRLEGKQGANHLYFRTSLFPAGQYVLRIKQGNGIVVKKVTIQ